MATTSKTATIPDVFIVESLKDSDPKDGKLLADSLRFSGKNPIYMTFSTEEELKRVLAIFAASNYRFLHVSCHGTATDLKFYDQNKAECPPEQIDYQSFLNIFPEKIQAFRLFFSACELGNMNISNIMMRKKKGTLHSVAAPSIVISFTNSASIWNAFYIAMFSDDTKGMKAEGIISKLKKITDIFNVDFHISCWHPQQKQIWHHKIKSDSKILNEAKEPYEKSPLAPPIS